MIKNGCVPDAKDVNKVFLISYFNNLFQAIENGETINNNNYDDYSFKYSRLDDISDFDNSASTCYYFDKLILFAELYDDFEDGVIDTTKWTTYNNCSNGNITESTGSINMNTSNNASGSVGFYSSGFDFKNQNSSAIFALHFSGSQGAEFHLSIYDGTTRIGLVSRDHAGSGYDEDFEIYFDKDNNRCKYRIKKRSDKYWGSWSDWRDLSPLNKWYVDFQLKAAWGTETEGNVSVYNFFKVSSQVTQELITSNFSFGRTYSSFMGYFDSKNANEDYLAYSTNNGSSYSELKKYELFVAQSGEIKVKIGVTTLPDKPAYIYRLGVLALS